MPRYLALEITLTTVDGGYRLQIGATAGDGNTTDPNVFLYIEKEGKGELQGICSPYDMATHPVEAPEAEVTPPFFREDTIDVIDTVEERLSEMADLVRQEVNALLLRLDRLDNVGVPTTVYVGTPPA